MTAGIMTITTGVLMKGDTSRLVSINAANSAARCPRNRRQPPAQGVHAAGARQAPLMMKRQAMVIGALLPNTPSTSLTSIRPRPAGSPPPPSPPHQA
jgi:hypothetical protein